MSCNGCVSKNQCPNSFTEFANHCGAFNAPGRACRYNNSPLCDFCANENHCKYSADTDTVVYEQKRCSNCASGNPKNRTCCNDLNTETAGNMYCNGGGTERKGF